MGWLGRRGGKRATTRTSRRGRSVATLGGALLLALALWRAAPADVPTPVPADQRGSHFLERSGIHSASNVRTEFWNYGMVGNYPPDPLNVDLSDFHSVEVPKGSGMNYSDGITPFVLARIVQRNGLPAYIMETGYRERQAISARWNRQMRFEPRPGYFEENVSLNPNGSPAVSSDSTTWPGFWPDRLDDPDDPGWRGDWNGYFGKQIVADQESYTVMDDQYYDAWDFRPDSRDTTRLGLGLRIEVRGFQWANPQARNVIFWHYDITNESTTDYADNIVFGLYMDSGVGGSAEGCDGIAESDDDNAYFVRTFDNQLINLVYTFDNRGHGRDLTSGCARTGYLGYAYLETPGKPEDLVDNDLDGITDELRDGGEGTLIIGQAEILAWVSSHYDVARFVAAYGPIEERPAYLAVVNDVPGYWWTGDEDLDWVATVHDVGADGLRESGDSGEEDGVPTPGEPNFDRTDLTESDQIGLTGFQISRIRPTVENIWFFTDEFRWPERLYNQFSHPDSSVRFGAALAEDANIAFLFASGPFTLRAGQTERFSLALAYGADLSELARTVQTVQTIYNANYRFAVPPTEPTVTAEEGDGYIRLSWNDVAERSIDPVTGQVDFEGYRIYRSTDPDFRDPQVIFTGTGTGPIYNGRPIAQFDLMNDISGFSDHMVEGVAFYLGTNSGLTHTWTDFSVTNGQEYFYGVCAYDIGATSPFNFPPSENDLAVARTKRGGIQLPPNVVRVRPNPRAAGFRPATAAAAEHVAGRGSGTVDVQVVNSGLVPAGHVFRILFATPHPDSIRASTYALEDTTTGEALFGRGRDLLGQGIGPVGSGLLPIIATPELPSLDTDRTGWREGSDTDARLTVSFTGTLEGPNRRRLGYPDDIRIEFSDAVLDTSVAYGSQFQEELPAKFRVIAVTPEGESQLDFRFRDAQPRDGTLSAANDAIDIVTYIPEDPGIPKSIWRVTLPSSSGVPERPPTAGDVFDLIVTRPYSADDVLLFTTSAEGIDSGAAKADFSPYVVPNPYVGSASFEPERYAVSGRGDRRMEFRGLPANCTVRIYNVRGELVQTLRHDGPTEGYVAWDLRTKDNLEVAPGLYIYHVDGGSALGSRTGKFAVIK